MRDKKNKQKKSFDICSLQQKQLLWGKQCIYWGLFSATISALMSIYATGTGYVGFTQNTLFSW